MLEKYVVWLSICDIQHGAVIQEIFMVKIFVYRISVKILSLVVCSVLHAFNYYAFF